MASRGWRSGAAVVCALLVACLAGQAHAEELRVRVLLGEERSSSIREIALERYVAGTVGAEVYPSWRGEILRAQAVAARTYALYSVAANPNAPFHVHGGTRGQVYGGDAAATPVVRQAVRDTSGEYLSFEGQPILAVYHSSSGGRTASAEEVWGQPKPYLVSVPGSDEEMSPDTYWRLAVPNRLLARELGRQGHAVGALRSLEVVDRSPSGRVHWLVARGAKREIRITGRQLREVLGEDTLRSTQFEIRRSGDETIFVGSGSGHGVGMSQWGALAMAQRGADYRAILKHYYPGTRLKRFEGANLDLAWRKP